MVQTRTVGKKKRGKQTSKENADSTPNDPKSSSTQQGQSAPSQAVSYPDWASYQAYYNAAGSNMTPPAGFHPQMWGPQMSPYGAPYVAMYPQGGVYPYPSLQPGQYPYPTQSPNGTAEASEKLKSDKKSKGKKKSDSSSDDSVSHNGESETDDSSEGSSSSTKKGLSSSKETSQNQKGKKGRKKQDSSAPTTPPPLAPYWPMQPASYPAGSPAITGAPATGEFWPAIAGTPPITMTVKPPAPRRNLALPESTPKDEREVKRQKRKQSNRESARRSRLKKQAEWELVAKCAAELKHENESLKEELKKLQDECDQLTNENASLKEKVNEKS